MKHRRFDKYVTLYTVCKEGGKVIYSYVETLPQHRLQDRSLKEFYRQVEEHGYDMITPSDKDYEQVVKAPDCNTTNYNIPPSYKHCYEPKTRADGTKNAFRCR